MNLRLTVPEFQDHVNDYDGVCLACGEWSCGGVEPDAEAYECESCGAFEVVGAEQAMVMGEIRIV